MRFFDIGIITIITVKIIFIILAITKIYVKHKEPNNKNKINNLEFWKKRVEFIFIVLMSILLIYLFNPRVNRLNMIDNEILGMYLLKFINRLNVNINRGNMIIKGVDVIEIKEIAVTLFPSLSE